MVFGLGSYGFGFLAGALSTLSPCVLPIIPILLGSAASSHPRGPLTLAGGLALSYAIVGSAFAWAGSSLGIDTSIYRQVGAVVLGLLGIVLMSANLQQWFASATAGMGDAGNRMISAAALDGLWGQFVIGLVLGVVWSPCVGPTLGATIVLASQGSNLPQVALLMGVFGIGAALPIVVMGRVSRGAFAKVRGGLTKAGKAGQSILGAALLALAALILSGADKPVESWFVDHSPAWLTILTTRF